MAVFLLLALPSVLNAQLSRQAYISAYQALEDRIWSDWCGDETYVTGPEASANVGDAASVLMQGQLTLYESTADRAYLDDFLKWANYILANINDAGEDPVYRRKASGSRYRGWGSYRFGYKLLALQSTERTFASNNEPKVFLSENNPEISRSTARDFEPNQRYLFELTKGRDANNILYPAAFSATITHGNTLLASLNLLEEQEYGQVYFTAPSTTNGTRLAVTITKTSGPLAVLRNASLGQYAEFCVHDGKIAAAFARFAALIHHSSPGFQALTYEGDSYLTWAETLRTIALELTEKWIRDYRYINEASGGQELRPTGDFHLFGDYGVLRGPDDASNARLPGPRTYANRSLPLNRFAAWALGALWVADAHPEMQYSSLRTELRLLAGQVYDALLAKVIGQPERKPNWSDSILVLEVCC